jgi:hypothetical protein
MQALDPATVVSRSGSNRFEMFMLALALVFNDFKGLTMCVRAFADSRPEPGEFSEEAGEWHGLNLQLHRLTVGLVRELLVLLEKFPDESKDPRIYSMLRHTEPKARRDWDDLRRIAVGDDPADREFTKVLIRIRGLAFHYDQPKQLVAGYRRHFFSGASDPHNKYALRSVAALTIRNRFYYADAAVQAMLATLQSRGDHDSTRFLREFERVREALYRTIGYLVTAYTDAARVGEPKW